MKNLRHVILGTNWFLIIATTFLINCGRTDLLPSISYNTPQEKTGFIFKHYPSSFSWASIDLDGDLVPENYMTSIKSQLCPDCYIQSALGLLEMQYQIENGIQEKEPNLSEQYIHNCHQTYCQGGGDAYNIFKFIKEQGVVSESVLEYDLNYQKCFMNCRNDGSIKRNSELEYYNFSNLYFPLSKHENKTTFFVDDYKNNKVEYYRKAMMKELQNAPMAVVFSRWWAFKRRPKSSIYYCDTESQGFAGHSVILVGYEKYGEILLIKNSHGGEELRRIEYKNIEYCGLFDNEYAISISGTYKETNFASKYCNANNDNDKDGILDQYDNCMHIKNPSQEDLDGDGFGKECDVDDFDEETFL